MDIPIYCSSAFKYEEHMGRFLITQRNLKAQQPLGSNKHMSIEHKPNVLSVGVRSADTSIVKIFHFVRYIKVGDARGYLLHNNDLALDIRVTNRLNDRC